MLSAEDIQARLHDSPFTPVQFVTTTGQTYDVYHPDMVFVTRRYLMIGLPAADSPSVADQVTRLSIIHVTEMKDLPRPASSSSGNGSATS